MWVDNRMDIAENWMKNPKETPTMKHGKMKGWLTQKGRQEREHNEKLILCMAADAQEKKISKKGQK